MVVHGYGAFVVNNIRGKGATDRLVDVLAGGPVFDPPAGTERVEWIRRGERGARCGLARTSSARAWFPA